MVSNKKADTREDVRSDSLLLICLTTDQHDQSLHVLEARRIALLE